MPAPAGGGRRGGRGGCGRPGGIACHGSVGAGPAGHCARRHQVALRKVKIGTATRAAVNSVRKTIVKAFTAVCTAKQMATRMQTVLSTAPRSTFAPT
jgi:hypothetical protein